MIALLLLLQSLTHGPFLGHVDPTSAKLWARAAAPGTYRLEISEIESAELGAETGDDLTLHWSLASLTPGRTYHYEICGATGSFTTPERDARSAKLAFGSCANDLLFPEQPVWARMREEGVEAVVLLGDTPYIDSTDLEVQRRRYREFFALPDLAALRGIPLYATWDDHDFGRNDALGELAGKEGSRRAFLEYHANPTYGDGESGIYTRFRRGPVEVFLLDTRWFAGTEPSPFDPDRPTLLGAAQWEWLRAGLTSSDAPFKVLACGMIWNRATRPLKVDHWMHFPHERGALFRFLGENEIGGVVLVSGDIHRTRAVRHASAHTVGYDLFELITSPMANTVIELANAPHPGLLFDAGVEETFLVLSALADEEPARLAARFLTHEGALLHELALTADDLARPAPQAQEPQEPEQPEPAALLWRDVRELRLEGQGWTDTTAPFDRLPARAAELVRPVVWDLSRQSAGLCARFVSDSPHVMVRWTLTSDRLALPHMPATGVSGLDLYARVEDGLRWVGTARPRHFPTNVDILADRLDEGRREYALYLPLYNGVRSVELGVPPGCELEPAPARAERPVVFYGTSITQGGSASRPGMAHTAILGRWLERPVINLGFSGSGTMDVELAQLMGELDAALFVVDCLPNMDEEEVRERLRPFVRTLRAARPDAPILLVEDRTYANAFLGAGLRERQRASRAALREGYEALRAEGLTGLFYLAGAELLGDDGEATVDGSHPTDLGFVRQARAFLPVLEGILEGR